MVKYYLFAVMVSVVLVSCRKEQRKINRIEGKWTVRSAEISGFGKVEPDKVFRFDWCKARHDDFCDFSVHDFSTGVTDYGAYSISKDGASLLLNWGGSQNYQFETFTIERLNFRTLILTNTNPISQYYSEIRLRSMD